MSTTTRALPKVLPRDNRNSYRPLSDRVITSIVADLISSLARWPEQTRSVRESETARIARKRKVTNLQVGGIRSNLSRGAYGDVSDLIDVYHAGVASVTG